MFLSAVQPYIVAIIIAVVVLQYALALFCLLKLAYLDIEKKYYILWNLFILIVFFIGSAAFLVYYYKHPQLRLSVEPAEPPSDNAETADQTENVDTDGAADQTENVETDGAAEQTEKDETDGAADQTENVDTDGTAEQTENVDTDGAADQTENVDND